VMSIYKAVFYGVMLCSPVESDQHDRDAYASIIRVIKMEALSSSETMANFY
jgi:hypothetical protein